MGRLSAPDFIVSLVSELVIWYETEDTNNPLGYPSKSPEARAMVGGGSRAPAGPLIPLRQLPARLAPVERAMNQMPDDMRLALVYRHSGEFKDFEQATGASRATWYKLCDAGYWMITGVVHAHLDRERV